MPPITGQPGQSSSKFMIRGLDPTIFAVLFLAATFVAAAVVGLAGFAFGLVASGIWLYILSPVQTATMIICFGFLVQSYAVWVLRGSLDWRRIWPMVLGSALGIPIGIAILTTANPALSAAWASARCWCSTACTASRAPP